MLMHHFFKRFLQTGMLLLAPLALVACKTTESGVQQDYSNGVNIAVPASGSNPAYHITENVGVAGSGFAYMLEKKSGLWRMMYDSFDAKAFAKPAANGREVPAGSEVLWTDGLNVVVYFGTEKVNYSRVDGSFECPSNKEAPGSRACRSQFTKAKSVFDGLTSGSGTRPYVLDFDEIKKAVADTGIVATAKKRLAK
jgi:hypothetical protein